MAEETSAPPRDWSVHEKVGATLAGTYIGQIIIGGLQDIFHIIPSGMTTGAIIGLCAFAAGYLFPRRKA